MSQKQVNVSERKKRFSLLRVVSLVNRHNGNLCYIPSAVPAYDKVKGPLLAECPSPCLLLLFLLAVEYIRIFKTHTK